MCKGLFSWENAEKAGNLLNFHAWSKILTSKTRNNTTLLFKNQILAHMHQFIYLFFCFTMCKGLFSWENAEKKVICEIFMCEAKSWQAKHVIIPHHYIKDEHWLTAIIWPYLCFWFTMCMGPFSWGNTDKIVNLWKFDVWSQISTGKRQDTTMHHYMQINLWLRCINV